MIKQAEFLVLLILSLTFQTACGTGDDAKTQGPVGTEAPPAVSESTEPATADQKAENQGEESGPVKIQITVGDSVLTAVPEENSSAEAFLALLQEQPLTVQMADYAGMEKVGPLGTDLPRNDAQISVGAGDVILYQGNQITIYYGTNSWSFTRLAVIEDATREGLLEVLGTGDVEVTFSLAD